MEKVYTINEVCEILKITRKTVYNWSDRGLLKMIHVCGNPRITESELKRLMKGE